MKWNVKDIAFLHRPDIFIGTFENEKMQVRYEKELQVKLKAIHKAIDTETDPYEAMRKLHKYDQLQFVLNNKRVFQEAERFEKAVILLYCRSNGPFISGGDVAFWSSLFAECDKSLLYDLGDPVPFESATVYRGSILGVEKGLSWTPDRQSVSNFAERWKDPSLGGGELYEIDIKKENVLVYLHHRREDEVILSPDCITTENIRIFKQSG